MSLPLVLIQNGLDLYKTGANLYDRDRFAPVFYSSSLPGFRQFAGRFGDQGGQCTDLLIFSDTTASLRGSSKCGIQRIEPCSGITGSKMPVNLCRHCIALLQHKMEVVVNEPQSCPAGMSVFNWCACIEGMYRGLVAIFLSTILLDAYFEWD